jgi:hypothetical protein
MPSRFMISLEEKFLSMKSNRDFCLAFNGMIQIYRKRRKQMLIKKCKNQRSAPELLHWNRGGLEISTFACAFRVELRNERPVDNSPEVVDIFAATVFIDWVVR